MRATLLLAIVPALYLSTVQAHEGGATCDASAAKQPQIEAARGKLKAKPKSTGLRTNLAAQLIELGCYDEAVHLLEDGVKLSPNDRNLQTRLKTARSFIGEREYLDQQAGTRATDAEVS